MDDGMACNVKEDSIEHILSFMGDVFTITRSYLEVYVKLHVIQMREERVIQIDRIQYMFSKLKKYGYENCILVAIHVDPHSVYNLSLHMGNGSIEDQSSL
jgi:cobalamin biosynthesis Co2+ chelatase CbiK